VASRFQELCQSLEAARERFAAYRSECVLFAATLSRGLMEYAAWPRELVTYEPVTEAGGAPTQAIEDAMHLDGDAFWQFGLRLALEVPSGSRHRDSIRLRVRFKKLETRYIVSLFGAEDYEVQAPTPEALRPIYDAILNAIGRHYDYGLRLFLENGGRGLRIPINTRRLLEMAHGNAAPTVPVQPAAAAAPPPAAAPVPAPDLRGSSPGSPGPRSPAPRKSGAAAGGNRASPRARSSSARR
jgi:hypothetical protein